MCISKPKSQELGQILPFAAVVFLKVKFEHFVEKAQYYLGEKFS